MKKLFISFLLIGIQILLYFLATIFIKNIVHSYIFSFIFIGFISILFFQKKSISYINELIIINIFFLIILFIHMSYSKNSSNFKEISPQNQSKIFSLRKSYMNPISKDNRKMALQILSFMAFHNYKTALQKASFLDKESSFKSSIIDYIKKNQSIFNKRISFLTAHVPALKSYMPLFYQGRFAEFSKRLQKIRNPILNPLIKDASVLAQEQIYQNLLQYKVNLILNEFITIYAKNNIRLLAELYYLFPEINNIYNRFVENNIGRTFSYFDVRNILRSDMEEALESNQKPIIILDNGSKLSFSALIVLGNNNIFLINPFITTQKGMFIRKNNIAQIKREGLVFPIGNHKSIFMQVMHLSEKIDSVLSFNPSIWNINWYYKSYQNRYISYYVHHIKPIHIMFYEILFVFMVTCLIMIITGKALKPHRNFHEYPIVKTIPFIFILFLSILYSNFSFKLTELIFTIFKIH